MEFSRALINKPLREAGVMSMSKTAPDAARAEALRLITESGANAAALSALVVGAEELQVADEPSSSADGGGPSALEEWNRLQSEAEATKGLSEDALAKLQRAELATARAFKLLKGAKGGELTARASETLLEASALAAEQALEVMAASSSSVSGKEDAKATSRREAAEACLAALKTARDQLSSVAVLDESSNLSAADLAEWESTASSRGLIELQQRLKEQKSEAEREIVDLKSQIDSLRELQKREEILAAQWTSLMRVATPEDAMVGRLMSWYLMSCMVGINVAFVSTGSLGVSFATALVVRCLPLVAIYLSKVTRMAEMAEGGEE